MFILTNLEGMKPKFSIVTIDQNCTQPQHMPLVIHKTYVNWK